MKKLLLLALLAATSLTACKKDDEDPKPVSKAEQLVNKRWRISAYTMSTTVNGRLQTEDLLPKLPSYNRDDFTTYKADKSFVDDEGPTKEDRSDPQTTAGTWDLNFEQNKLYLTYSNDGTFGVELLELTNARMVWRFVDSSSTPVETYTLTYVPL